MLIISNMKTKFVSQSFAKRAMMVLAVLCPEPIGHSKFYANLEQNNIF